MVSFYSNIHVELVSLFAEKKFLVGNGCDCGILSAKNISKENVELR